MTTANEKDAIQRRDEALEVAQRFGKLPEAHQKAWVMDQMCRILLGAEYAAWVDEANANPETGEWDIGISPEHNARPSTVDRPTPALTAADRAFVLTTTSTATANDLTVHLERCVAIQGQPGCTCQQIEEQAMREQLRNLLGSIPQQTQRQDSTTDQLADLHAFADRLGLYDAADAIKKMVSRAK